MEVDLQTVTDHTLLLLRQTALKECVLCVLPPPVACIRMCIRHCRMHDRCSELNSS